MASVASEAVVLLAGGNSTRMGSDKAALLLGEKTLLQHNVDTALALGLPVYLAAADKRYPNIDRRVSYIADAVGELAGPLSALVGALQQAQNDGYDCLWVLSCDQLIGIKRLREHIGLPLSNKGVMLKHDACVQPLLAVYSVDLCPIIAEAFVGGERRLRWLAGLEGVETITMPRQWTQIYSINTPEDFLRAQIYWNNQHEQTQL